MSIWEVRLKAHFPVFLIYEYILSNSNIFANARNACVVALQKIMERVGYFVAFIGGGGTRPGRKNSLVA